MLEIFRRIDIERRSRRYSGSGGRFDRVFTDEELAARREESVREAIEGSDEQEKVITEIFQKVFDNQVTCSPPLRGRSQTIIPTNHTS